MSGRESFGDLIKGRLVVALVVVVGFNQLFGLCCGGNGSVGALGVL